MLYWKIPRNMQIHISLLQETLTSTDSVKKKKRETKFHKAIHPIYDRFHGVFGPRVKDESPSRQ